jgi:hypothetical protein
MSNFNHEAISIISSSGSLLNMREFGKNIARIFCNTGATMLKNCIIVFNNMSLFHSLPEILSGIANFENS